jgi:hypothetical protein
MLDIIRYQILKYKIPKNHKIYTNDISNKIFYQIYLICHKGLKSYDVYDWSIYINLIEVLNGNNQEI